MARPALFCLAVALGAVMALGACNRSTEKQSGVSTSAASTGTVSDRGTAGETNPAVSSGASGTADRTGATAPTGTTGLIGASGGVPRHPDEAPKAIGAGSPGSSQNGDQSAGAGGSRSGGASGFRRSGSPASDMAGTLPGKPGAQDDGAAAMAASRPASAGISRAPLPGSIAAAIQGGGPLSSTDRSFVTTAATSGLFEVQMAQLAASRASSSEVKAYATMLVNQHVNASNELAQLAAVHSVALPSELPKDLQTQLRKLSNNASKPFDREFVQAAIKAHERDIASFERAGGKVQDPQLKAWVEKTLPALRQHLQAAQQLARGA